MNSTLQIERELDSTLQKLKHVKIENFDDSYSAALTDKSGYEIVKGYGKTYIDAINDMHAKLL